jgi:uncharacterized protein
MKILVDADACPVKEIVVEVALEFGCHVVMISNPSHLIPDYPGAEWIIVEGTSQSADIELVNRTTSGDVLITADYGVAAMAMAKGGRPLSPRGHIYKEDRIDGMLAKRHFQKIAAKNGQKFKGPSKHTDEDNQRFRRSLRNMFEEPVDGQG